MAAFSEDAPLGHFPLTLKRERLATDQTLRLSHPPIDPNLGVFMGNILIYGEIPNILKKLGSPRRGVISATWSRRHNDRL